MGLADNAPEYMPLMKITQDLYADEDKIAKKYQKIRSEQQIYFEVICY